MDNMKRNEERKERMRKRDGERVYVYVYQIE